jgi:hypothetical protein
MAVTCGRAGGLCEIGAAWHICVIPEAAAAGSRQERKRMKLSCAYAPAATLSAGAANA